MEADVGRKGVEGAGGCLGEGPWDGVGRGGEDMRGKAREGEG